MRTIASNGQVRLLVIDDHPIVRDSCLKLLARRSDISTMEATTAAEGLEANRSFLPEIIVLDIALGDVSGFDVIPTLLCENPTARIVVFSMYGAGHFVTRALNSGAHGYITKNDDPNELLAAIDKVRSGDIYFSPAAGHAVALSHFGPTRDRVNDLSEREFQVVTLLGQGKSLSEIAFALGIGYKSAAGALAGAKQKLGFSSRTALIKFAVERAKL